MINSADFSRLIAHHGQTLTLTKVTTSGTYSPSTGTVTGSASTAYRFTGFVYNTVGSSTDASKTLKTSQSLVMSALNLGFTPEEGDSVTGQGEIISVKTVNTGGTSIVYLCELDG